MKKQLLQIGVAFAATLFLAGGVLAQHHAPLRVENCPAVAEFANVPVMDGADDDAGWSAESAIGPAYTTTGWDGDADLGGYVKFCWDKWNFYFFAQVNDDIDKSWEGTGDQWTFDNVELFLDIDTTVGDGAYGTDAIQIRFNRSIDTTTGTKGRNDVSYEDSFIQLPSAGAGWAVEATIPWLAVMPAGTLPDDIWTLIDKEALGFDVQYADRDVDSRDAQRAWDDDTEGAGTPDNAWNNTAKFGLLKLTGTPYPTSTNSTSANNFEIYPNPASNNVTFANLSGVTSIEIVNLIGQSVKAVEINNETVVINVADLATGNYIVKLHTNVGIVTEKLIVR